MTAAIVVIVIMLLLIIASLDAMREDEHTIVVHGRHSPHEAHTETMIANQITDDEDMGKTFTIDFGEGRIAPAIRVEKGSDAQEIVTHFGLVSPRPTIFISGGAGMMSDEDIERTRAIIVDGVATFADKYHITIVDGGTESGVMKMIGDARLHHDFKFPLIGVSPDGLISYPGYQNPNEQANLENGHSHFVLVEGENWGDESQMIVNLTRAIAAGQPMIGLLINGGKIAEQDVYIATAKATAHERIPILVLEGSGRTADNISTAFRTGETQSAIIRAIVTGGDIRLTSIAEGAEAMFQKLEEHFQKQL